MVDRTRSSKWLKTSFGNKLHIRCHNTLRDQKRRESLSCRVLYIEKKTLLILLNVLICTLNYNASSRHFN